MISHDILNIDWLTTVSESLNRADKILLEKICRALLLLEGLVEANLDFVFKGGTAVMLLLEEPRRFSIDIDIVMAKPYEVEPLFKSFVKQKGFTRYELQHRRTESDIAKLHYKFFYDPVHRTSQNQDYVLLDILIEEIQYREIKGVSVSLPFIPQTGESVQVNVPGVNDIIADKLTAFAPNTTGIPYEKNGQSMSMEIIKQLYDIRYLFEMVDNLKEISIVFQNISNTELGYRKIDKSIEDVLDDILLTALCISSRGRIGKGDFTALQTGIQRLASYIFSESYHIDKAIVHAARAAYLSSLIRYEKEEILFFDGPEQILEWDIEQPEINRLNRLKKTNPEAFYYWYQVEQLYSKRIAQIAREE